MSPHTELKIESKQLIFINAPKIFFIGILFVAISTLLSEFIFQMPGRIDFFEVQSRLAAGEAPSFQLLYGNLRPVGVWLAVLMSLFRPIINVGLMSYCLKVRRKQDTEYKDLLNGFQVFFKVIIISIISSIFIFLWSLLFIIPGLVASYRYRLAYYILLDDPKKGPLQCIKESAVLMKGSKLDLFILDISFIIWHLLDIVVVLLIPLPFTLPLISIYLSPYIGLTVAGFYENRISKIAA